MEMETEAQGMRFNGVKIYVIFRIYWHFFFVINLQLEMFLSKLMTIQKNCYVDNCKIRP